MKSVLLVVENPEYRRKVAGYLALHGLGGALVVSSYDNLLEYLLGNHRFSLVVVHTHFNAWTKEIKDKGVLAYLVKQLLPDARVVCINDGLPGKVSDAVIHEIDVLLRPLASTYSFRVVKGLQSKTLVNELAETRRFLKPSIKLLRVHKRKIRCSRNCTPIGVRIDGKGINNDAVEVMNKSRSARFWVLDDSSNLESGEAAEYLPGQGWRRRDDVLAFSRKERDAWRKFSYNPQPKNKTTEMARN